MPLLSIEKDPTRSRLIVFGIGLPIVIALVGWRLWRAELVGAAELVGVMGVAVTLVFAFVRSARRPIYVGWMIAVSPIAFVVSHVVLLAVFFGVLTPLALVLRAIGKDPLRRKLDPNAQSYWIERLEARPKTSYFRQF